VHQSANTNPHGRWEMAPIEILSVAGAAHRAAKKASPSVAC